MYTLKLLAPLVVAMCAEGLTTGQGDTCVLDTPKPSMVYYEPGKSCYVNGIFYKECSNAKQP